MTGTNVIARVRQQISDQTTTYRWDDTVMLLYLNDGRREITRRHPEAMYVSSIVVDPVTDMTTLTADIDLTDYYINALVHYVCFRILIEDAENAVNAQTAVSHKQLFEEQM